MDEIQQKVLVDLLAQLETAFEYLIVETTAEADNGLFHIYQAAQLILLTITPEADSLTQAFTLLRTLKRQYEDQPVHVIVDMAANLPNAHDTFKKLRHAASKYLQIEPHYLGYFPSQQPLQVSLEPGLAAASFHPDALSDHHFEAIAGRFCAIAETIVPLTCLSRHFGRLCSAMKTTEGSIASASAPDIKKAEIPTPGARRDQEGWPERSTGIIALYDAAHYAALLAKREAQQ